MDNFFDMTTVIDNNMNDAVDLTFAESAPLTMSPVEKRKRKFEEMESLAGLHLPSNKDELVVDQEAPHNGLSPSNNHNHGHSPIEVVLPPPPKKRRTGDEPTLSKLLYSNNMSDITFQVGNKQFPVIKAIFAVKSPRFETMLFPENSNGNQSINFIEIIDITANAFGFIRDFCYDLDIDLNNDNVIDILHASKIYEINKLTEQCIAYLKQIDNVNELLLILKQIADKQNDFGLLDNEVCDLLENNASLLQTNGTELIEHAIFHDLPFPIASTIITSDNLGVKEEDLWNACKHWSQESGFKALVRFCLMGTAFLYNQVKPSGVLTENDLVSIYEMKLGLVQSCVFNCTARIIVKKRKRRSSKKKLQEVEEIVEDNKDENEIVCDVEGGTQVEEKKGRGRGKTKTTPKSKKGRGRSRKGAKK